MRKMMFVCAAVAAMLCAVACEKNLEVVPGNVITSGQDVEMVEMRLSIVGDGGRVVTTKTSVASFDDDHSVVDNVQFFVFDGEVLDAYKKTAGGTSASLTVRAGEKTVWAVVNAPDISDVYTLSQLKAVRSTLLDNASHFVMVGSTPATVPSSDPIEIEVKRIVSRVTVKKVTAAFSNPAYSAMSCQLVQMYLVNAPANTSLDLSAAPTEWYSKRENETVMWLSDHLSTNCMNHELNSSPYVKECRHYCYPNPTVPDSHAASWCPRHTRMVIEVLLNSETFFYPVTLPVLEPGKSYEIENLTITRKGSSSPDQPIVLADANFELNVKDWTVVPVTEGVTL